LPADEDLRAAVQAVSLLRVLRQVEVSPAAGTYGGNELDVGYDTILLREGIADRVYMVL
jgi:hypothetical protein